MIRGIDVTLYERQKTGVDGFGRPIYKETPVTVANVLVTPASPQEIIDELNLSGKRLEYTLSIPKGDAHAWDGATVEFFGRRWHVIGLPQEWIEDMVPLAWNKKIKVERIE